MQNIRKYFSESTISLVMGVVVVIALSFIAYQLFKGKVGNNNTVKPGDQKTVTESVEKSREDIAKLTEPSAAVSLPAKHIVVTGETLWSIADKYYASGYNWVDIAKDNGLINANIISVGQTLSIPNVPVRQPQVAQKANKVELTITTSPVADKEIRNETYTVVKGDNLWKIAVRSYGDGFRWTVIAKANNLRNPRLIHAGNVLVIPRP